MSQINRSPATDSDSDIAYEWQGRTLPVKRPIEEFAALIERIDACRKLFYKQRFSLAYREAAELRSIVRTTRGLPSFLYHQVAALSREISFMQ